MEAKWRLVDTETSDPHWNLAVEESVAKEVGAGRSPDTLRFWRADNAVFIGRFQEVDLEVNKEACRRYGTCVLRRFTGGGAVYHDLGNLNWALSVQRDHPLFMRPMLDIRDTFAKLSAGLTVGLLLLGLRSEFVPPNGIQIKGNKVSGTAGSFKWGTVFFHGTLLVGSDVERIREILDVPEGVACSRNAVRSVRRPMTTLRDELKRDVPMAEVKQALRNGFERALGIRLTDGVLVQKEIRSAREILQGFRTVAGERQPARSRSAVPGPPLVEVLSQ